MKYLPFNNSKIFFLRKDDIDVSLQQGIGFKQFRSYTFLYRGFQLLHTRYALFFIESETKESKGYSENCK